MSRVCAISVSTRVFEAALDSIIVRRVNMNTRLMHEGVEKGKKGEVGHGCGVTKILHVTV